MCSRCRVSWWKVAWRLLWALPAYTALAVYCLTMWAGWGYNPAQTWKDCS